MLGEHLWNSGARDSAASRHLAARRAPIHGYERRGRMPFAPNTAIAFLNLGEAYHAVDAIDRPIERWTLQYSLRIERIAT
jgi:hypothetical protein